MKMTKITLIFVILTALAQLNAGSQTVPVELTKFTCETFSVRYFPSWRLKSDPETDLFIDVIYNRESTSSLSISSTPYRGNQEQMRALLERKNEEIVEMMTEAARERVPGYQVLDHGTTKLGGFAAYWFISSYNIEGFGIERPVRSMTMMALRKGKIIRVFVEATPTGFRESSSEIRQMLATFVYR
jgi:hypothetical protein